MNMLKKAVIIAAILILLQIATAREENYNQYSYLELNVNVHTTINLEQKGGRSTIDYLKAELELFPRITPEQEVDKQEVTSNPTATTKKGEDKITLEWDNTNKDTIEYEVGSTVRTYNKVRKIAGKINFPIKELQPEVVEYTKPTEYIDINQPIREKAAEIAEGETDLYIVTYKLGDWVRSNVKYDLNTLTAGVVQKSSWVMSNKEGVCDELTNLFISMARSLGIPTRFVSGVVYSNVAYSFDNHGWAEVYFPDHGWVPFDVTFGQYGWIDPSHIKMDESKDSGDPSVTYSWEVRNGELKAESLKVDTTILSTEGEAARLAKLEIKPLEQDVSFGSFMIVEVSAENTQNYYLPLTFGITKAPQTLEDNPEIHTVLKPKEKKKFYWILKIPNNLDSSYIYTTELEVKSNFAETAKSQIRYGQGFKTYTKQWAEQNLQMLTERENKTLFTDLGMNCSTDKDNYLSVEDIKIKCMIRNLGNKNLDKIQVCTKGRCKEISLTIAQEQEINFEINLKKSENLTITAEQDKYIKEQAINLNIKEIPEVRILSYEPDSVEYQKSGNLALKLFTETKAKDVVVQIKKVGEAKIPQIEGAYTVNVPIKGKNFRDGIIELDIKYKSEKGESFERQEKLGITILGLPWYAKLLNWLGL